MSFTQQHFALTAKALGTHVIPTLCTRHDWNAGGALKWDVDKITDFHKLGNFIVDFFQQQNSAFDLTRDLPGLAISGKEREPTSWTFYPIVTNKGWAIG